MKILLLTVVLLFSVSCGKKNTSSKPKQVVTQYFVNGDPLVVMAETVKDKNSFLTPQNISQFDNFSSQGISIFTETQIIEEDTSEGNIEEGNEAQEEDQTEQSGLSFKFTNLGRGNYSYADSKAQVGFIFRQNQNKLELSELTFQDTRFPITPEHYSISPDGSKISFLGSSRDETGKFVVAITLFKPASTRVVARKTDTIYKYIAGPGVIAPWKLNAAREVAIDICPSAARNLGVSLIQNAFARWNNPTSVTLVKIKTNVVPTCKPFTDVNQHAVYYINSYLTEMREDSSNPAVTSIMLDSSRAEIFDADILVFGAELNKSRSDYTLKHWVLMHEFGHFLGLDHQFDGTTSIMSYKQTASPSAYDVRAIERLYGN